MVSLKLVSLDCVSVTFVFFVNGVISHRQLLWKVLSSLTVHTYLDTAFVFLPCVWVRVLNLIVFILRFSILLFSIFMT